MNRDQRKRLNRAATIFALYGIILGLPSALFSGSLADIPVVALIFGLPTLWLDRPSSRTTYDRVKEHS
jgi:hypothetical protein